jgi:N6-L-threonylcarbamoyladenine synthase
VSDLAAAFEAAAVEPLVAKARRAVAAEGVRAVAVVGGVAANRRLRDELAVAAERDGFRAVFPPVDLCTDNAAMIAAAGARLLERGEAHGLALNSFSRVPVGSSPWGRGAAA